MDQSYVEKHSANRKAPEAQFLTSLVPGTSYDLKFIRNSKDTSLVRTELCHTIYHVRKLIIRCLFLKQDLTMELRQASNV